MGAHSGEVAENFLQSLTLSRGKWIKDFRASSIMPWRQRKPELTEMWKGMDGWDLAQELDTTTGPPASLPKGLLAPKPGGGGHSARQQNLLSSSRAGFYFLLCHNLAVCPWTGHFTSPSLSFFICETGLITWRIT